jgi:hypothetical protein
MLAMYCGKLEPKVSRLYCKSVYMQEGQVKDVCGKEESQLYYRTVCMHE